MSDDLIGALRELEAAETEGDRLRAELALMERQRDHHAQLLDKSDAENWKLKTKLAATQAKCERMVTASEESEGKYIRVMDGAHAENDRLRAELAAMTQRAETAEDTVGCQTDLEKDFATARTENEALRKRVAELEGLFSHVGVETHKWLDPECGHEGCQSLVLKARAEQAEKRVAELEAHMTNEYARCEAWKSRAEQAEAQLASKTAAFALATVHAKELEAALKHETDCVEAAKAQLASLRPSVAEIERDEAIARAEQAEAQLADAKAALTKYGDQGAFQALRDGAERAERAEKRVGELEEALEPFAHYADVKGGTLSGNTLQALIGEMMERLPYPEHLEAINLFCKACQEARAALGPSPAGEKS